MTTDVSFTVGEFVGLLNQTLEFAYPNVTITGEIANFRVSKNRWVYFDLKDEEASVKFFGTVYQLPGPLEDGMMVAVRGVPRLHPQYGFSVTVQSMQPVGEGSIKKAAALLQAKLAAEGLFDVERKRVLPYPPAHIGLITSSESAAYRDFMKIMSARWGGVRITLIDVQVQGEAAIAQVARAVAQFNELAEAPEVLVVTRGGGSAEDLGAFSTEQVTRAIAASRIPTLVAIGHEVDVSLAELAADQRASTPSNAAELLVPDRQTVFAALRSQRAELGRLAHRRIHDAHLQMVLHQQSLFEQTKRVVNNAKQELVMRKRLLLALDPRASLARGYAIVRKSGSMVRSGTMITIGDELDIELQDGRFKTKVTETAT